jgi:LPPG:FO 2-phospho-L-lactate transferase
VPVRVTLLAGGVGGARFALGLVDAIGAEAVTIVGNVGDDVDLLDLHVSPDLDTCLYTLAGIVHPEQGWGVEGDTREALGVVGRLGGDDWFILGDRDIGLHLVRTQRLRAGEPLSSVMRDVASRLRIGVALLPATDDRLRTHVATDEGELGFQEWFVGRRAAPAVRGLRFEGAPGARPAPGVLEAIERADRIVLAPSNPFISLDPILAVDGLRDAVEARRADVVAVAPIIGRRAVKGPLGEMLDALGHERSPAGVARYLAPLAARFVLDASDAEHADAVRTAGLEPVLVPALMRDAASRLALARAALG